MANEIFEHKIYRCNLCKFKTFSRKKIREHVRKKHGVKGKKPYGKKHGMSPVTHAYRREEIWA